MNSCEITLHNDGTAEVKSNKKLFNSLLGYTNGDTIKALDLYGITLTDGFKNIGIKSPTLENILSYVDELNSASMSQLSVQDELDFLNIRLQNTAMDDVRERFIDAFTYNGYFKIDYNKIKKSNLFSEAEIYKLYENLPKIQTLYYKYKNNEDLITSIVTPYTTDINTFDKQNPDIIETHILENYAGLETKDEVINKAIELEDDFIIESEDLINNILDKVSNNDIQVTYDFNPLTDTIEKRKINDTFTRLIQTLSVEEDYSKLMDAVDYLRISMEEDYDENNIIYSRYLPALKQLSLDVGIDLSGLVIKPNNYEQVSELLDSLYNMLYDLQNQNSNSLYENIEYFSNIYDDVVGKTYETVYTVKEKSELNDIHLETNQSELSLFINNSLIKIAPYTYRKINNDSTIDELYTLLLQNPELLPENIFSVSIKDRNIDILIEELDKHISDKASELITDDSTIEDAKLLTALKYINNSNEMNIEEKTGSYEMDINSFLSDFNKIILSDNILSNIFYFSKKGLESKINIGEYTIEQLKIILDDKTFDDLVNYAKISGSYSLKELSELNQDINEGNTRDYYANNLDVLPNYKGEYNTNGDYYIIKSNKSFIKLRNKLLEKVDDNVYAEVDKSEKILNSGLQKPVYNNEVTALPEYKNGGIIIEKTSTIKDNTIEFC